LTAESESYQRFSATELLERNKRIQESIEFNRQGLFSKMKEKAVEVYSKFTITKTFDHLLPGKDRM
jgi:hypothetical protein